jgi:uncharacterized Zn-binding protein involved in type VI secretion
MGQPAARKGDRVIGVDVHTSVIVSGAPTVLIG